jgi:endoglucanase
MDTPRVTLQINATSPGTEVAAETAAALAAASLALRESHNSNATYADMLLDTAITV